MIVALRTVGLFAIACAFANPVIPRFDGQLRPTRLLAWVTSADGRGSENLNSNDFEVLSLGRSLAFTLSHGRPLSLLVIVDVSDSMTRGTVFAGDVHGPFMSEMAKGLRELRTTSSENEVQVATLSGKLLISEKSYSDPGQMAASFLTLDQRGGPSPIWDAVHAGAEALQLAADRGRQTALVVLTDGLNSGSLVSRGDAVERAKRSSTALYLVKTIPMVRIGASDRRYATEITRILTEASASTGGLYLSCGTGTRDVFCPEGGGLSGHLSKIVDDLTTRYEIILGESLDAEQVAAVSVRVRNQADAKVRIRAIH